MKTKGFLATIKGFLAGYAVYLGIWLAIAEIAVSVDRDYFVQNWSTYKWFVTAVFIFPFLLFGLSIWQGSVAKRLRLLTFSIFRVEVFVLVSLFVLVLFTMLFLQNLFRHTFQGEQIFLNVLLLNLIFIFFLALILADKFQIKQPSALLIRRQGHTKVYLYRDGVIRHIPDPPTLRLLGYSFGDVVDVSDTEFKVYVQRPAIESVTTARLVQVEDGPGEVWTIFGDTRKYVPDLHTLKFILQLRERSIEAVTEDKLNAWEESSPLVSVLNLTSILD